MNAVIFGEKGLYYVMKILKWSDHSGLSDSVLNAIISIFPRESQREIRHRERGMRQCDHSEGMLTAARAGRVEGQILS